MLLQKVLTPLCREQLEPSCYLMNDMDIIKVCVLGFSPCRQIHVTFLDPSSVLGLHSVANVAEKCKPCRHLPKSR